MTDFFVCLLVFFKKQYILLININIFLQKEENMDNDSDIVLCGLVILLIVILTIPITSFILGKDSNSNEITQDIQQETQQETRQVFENYTNNNFK